MKKFRFGYHLSKFFYCVKIRLLLNLAVTQRAGGTKF